MKDPNPYAAPSSNLGGDDSFGDNTEGVTRGVVDQLTRTKGWTRFISTLAYLLAMGVVALAIFGGRMMNELTTKVFGFQGIEGMLAVVVVIAVVVAGLAITYGALLGGFSSAVNRLIESGKESDLADALDRQRRFWIFSGVLSVIGVLFSIVGLF